MNMEKHENKVLVFNNENDFYCLIEKKLKKHGFELLNTLPLISKESSCGASFLGAY